jgi:DNA-binding NtrC family response regulator
MSAATAIPSRIAQGRILVASSHSEFRDRILKSLGLAAPLTAEAAGGADALIKLESNDYATLFIDPDLEDLDVEELVTTIHARFPLLNVVVVDPSQEAALDSFNLSTNERLLASGDSPEENMTQADASSSGWMDLAEAPPARLEPLPSMIGTSRRMQQLYRLARLVAPRDTAVLIVGGTGTGKELVARGIHALSRRSRGPFVVVNCAAIPESLLEAELFGFARGAFTGAFQSRLGRIHAAHGGTLLLDEVGELPLSMQAKLLRFVQEGEVQRLGSADLFRVDARLIAATNADLLQRVREKQFREDLYYRLAVFPLSLPSLANRPEDILPLAQHFLAALCAQAGVPRKMFSAEAAALLRKYSWPGNVRELQHWIERAFVMAEGNGQIRAEHLALQSEPA